MRHEVLCSTIFQKMWPICPAMGKYIWRMIDYNDQTDSLLCAQPYADTHGIYCTGRKNLQTINFENFVFFRKILNSSLFFVFLCIAFLVCTIWKKIRRHSYIKYKKNVFSTHSTGRDHSTCVFTVLYWRFPNR